MDSWKSATSQRTKVKCEPTWIIVGILRNVKATERLQRNRADKTRENQSRHPAMAFLYWRPGHGCPHGKEDWWNGMMVRNQMTILEPEELNQELHQVLEHGKTGRLGSDWWWGRDWMLAILQGHCCSLGMRAWRKVVPILNVTVMTFKKPSTQTLTVPQWDVSSFPVSNNESLTLWTQTVVKSFLSVSLVLTTSSVHLEPSAQDEKPPTPSVPPSQAEIP